MDCILITCDQVIHYQNTIREKPESSQQCREYLASYEKYPAVTVCGVVALNTRTGKMEKGYDIAKQHFKHIPPNIVDQLIAKGDIMHCAGGFMIDDPLIRPYLGEREGTEESIIGMPMHLVKELIAKCAEA